MEAFLAAQVLYGGENSDSDSFKSDLSETYGASSYQRRPGSGRRKKQAPWRSPWDASVSTDYAPQYLPPDYEPSRLGLAAIIDPSPSSRPITPVIEVGAAAVSNPNPAFKSKKAKQDLSGPCCHCNATSSPQWRKGPKGKPVLCNACGIRFLRTRTLGKAMPKKRRTTAAAAGGEHMALTQPKRIKADEASTEEEEFNTEEVLAADDANMAVDESLEEANSGSLNHSSIGFPDLAAAVVMGHHAGHAYHQSAAALLPISRLALASSAAGALHDETGYAETQECGQYGQFSEQQYAQQQYASRAPVDLNAATAAALVPQLSWLTTSINPLGPNAAAGSGSGSGSSLSQQALQTAAMRLAAAAAIRRVGTTSSSSSDVRGHNALSSSSSPGLTEPLAAGSRLLLSAGAGSKANNNPSLTAVLAMHHHQQQLQRECSSDQQQPQSPLALGIYSSSALAGSPISHQSALQPYLKAEFSGLSYGTGSAPASPLALPAAASSGMYHMTLSSNSSGGIYSACTSTRQQQQQLQHGLHRPSPLSVMAATAAAVDASVAAHQDALSAADGREGLGAAAPEQLGDLAAARCPQVSGQVDDIMYNTAAAAVPDSTPTVAGTGEASTPDMTQLIRLVANALGGMGNTWEVLKSLNNNTVTPAAAAVTAAGGAHLESVISRAVLQQQHQYP